MTVFSRSTYLDPEIPIDERVANLASQLTLEEKVSQMLHSSPAIERLGIPAYNWWSECLHGVARYGLATVFPQAIGMAATWNLDMIKRIGKVISDEARAKYNDPNKVGTRTETIGLTYWSPNINIFRDPRWGRGQETYGEDPYLTARIGVTFVNELQGKDKKYLKLIATPKHYAVHSGPEADRHHFDAIANQRDIRETYLPAFKACVQEANAYSIMGAYNRTNGEACCASNTLLQQILREEWGFEGYVVSDCGAITDIYHDHKIVATPEEAAALAVKNGCDLNCGDTYSALVKACKDGLISEAEINLAVTRLFKARFLLGMFDPQEIVPYNRITFSVLDCPDHRMTALEAARESMVLLKNEENFLPLNLQKIKKIAVIGPKANDTLVLYGNYYGTPAEPVTLYEGLKKRVSSAIDVKYAEGCDLSKDNKDGFAEAVALAKESDVAVVVLGLSQLFEGEETQEEGNPPGQHSFGDRTNLDLPGVQEDLLKAIQATGTKVVLVLLNGSALSINWAQSNIPAILEAWYPGQAGGLAVADVLLGLYNPGGRLPITFYRSIDDISPFTDYKMEGKTYRFVKKPVLYPFGYGLSYTTFEYKYLDITHGHIEVGESVTVQVTVKNTGKVEGDEVVQLYIKDIIASVPVAEAKLAGFSRVHLVPGEEKRVSFKIDPEQMQCYKDDGEAVIEPGDFKVWVGGCSPAVYGATVSVPKLLEGQFTVVENLKQEVCEINAKVNRIDRLQYLLHLPKDISCRRKYPLILFLHGAGERGTDIQIVRKNGIPRIVEELEDFPFITISPQCPENTWWSDHIEALIQMIDDVCANYPVDDTRIYLTGLSMGGFGTWHLACCYPEKFAAIAPICGGGVWCYGFPERVRDLKKLPVWVFHGAKDDDVPLAESKILVDTLKSAGGNVRFTIYPEAHHDSWTETYNNPQLYKWFLLHQRRNY